MSSFLKNQARQILNSQSYACFLTALFVQLPYATWISLTTVALVTLRKGHSGLMVVLFGMLACVIQNYFGFGYSIACKWTILALLMSFFSAYLLKKAENWCVVLPGILLTTLIGLIFYQYWMPESIAENFQVFISLFKDLKPGMVDMLDNEAVRAFMPSYLLGVEGLALVTTALLPVLIARYIQSMLFYPEGFRQEIFAFRAHRMTLLLLVCCLMFIRYGNVEAACCLPLLALYLVVSGFSLAYSFLRKKEDRVVLVLLLVPAILMPYIAFPIYLLLGCFDSLVRIRTKKLETS